MVLATHHRYGEGHAYYIGTYLGLALYKRVPDAIAWMREVLLRHAAPPVRGGRLRPRLVRGSKAALLIVFNDHAVDAISESIPLPELYARATDVAIGKTVEINSHQFLVSLGPEGVAVYRLEG